MSLKTLFVLTAVVSAAFGLALLLAPARLMALYALNLDAGGLFISQLFGAALLGVAVVAWMARHAEASVARNAIITGFFICSAVGFVVSFTGRTLGAANALAWLNVAIYFLFAAGYGYFRFLYPEERH